MKYFLLSFIIILLSTPLGYKIANMMSYKINLTGQYVPILKGFIHSFMLIGILVFSIGLIDALINKNNKF